MVLFLLLVVEGVGDHAGEAVLHAHFVTRSVEADDEVVGGIVVGGPLEDLFILGDGVLVLSQSDVGVADVSSDFEPHFLGCGGENV